MEYGGGGWHHASLPLQLHEPTGMIGMYLELEKLPNHFGDMCEQPCLVDTAFDGICQLSQAEKQ